MQPQPSLLATIRKALAGRPPEAIEHELAQEEQREAVSERKALHDERVAWEAKGKKRLTLAPKIAEAHAEVEKLERLWTYASDRKAANDAVVAARKKLTDLQSEWDACDSPRRMELIHALEASADPAIWAARQSCLEDAGNIGRFARHQTLPPAADDIGGKPRVTLLNGPALEAKKRASLWAADELEQLARRYVDDVGAAIAAILAEIPSA